MGKQQKSVAVSFEAIHVQTSKGSLQNEKLLQNDDALAIYEGHTVYIGRQANWTVKAKTMTDVKTVGRSMQIMCSNKTVIELQTASADAPWDLFCKRVVAAYQKHSHTFGDFLQSSTQASLPNSPQRKKRLTTNVTARRRPRAAFGKNARRRLAMAKDDGWASAIRQESFSDDDDAQSPEQPAAADEQQPDMDVSPSEPEDDATQSSNNEEMDHLESESEQSSSPQAAPAKRRRKARRRLQKMKKKVLSDDDTDTEDDCFNKPSLTTPAAQRIVSPGSTRTTDTKEQTKQKAAIDSFFKPRPTTNIQNNPHHHAHSTPIRSSAKSPTVARLANSTKRSLIKNQHTVEWLANSSAAVTSPIKQASTKLFGPSSRYFKASSSKNVNDQDPIEEYDGGERSSSPNARKRARRMFQYPVAKQQSVASLKSPPRFSSSIGLKPKKRIMAIETAEDTNVDNDEPPVIIRNPFRGLRNLGNTCYMNSSLQMLCTPPGFMNRLESQIARVVVQAADTTTTTTSPLLLLTQSVVKVAQELQVKDNPSAVNPHEIKDEIDKLTVKFQGYEQRDAHEFLSDLVDHVHEEIDHDASNSNDAPTTDDFKLTVQMRLECQSCGYARTKDEIYRHLSIDIVSNDADDTAADPTKISRATVEAGLTNFFKPDIRELKCEKCQKGTHASQHMRILERPKTLLLHLKRFIVMEKQVQVGEENAENGTAPLTYTEYVTKKDRSQVAIPETLSLSAFETADKVLDETTTASSGKYSLQSVVHHIGSRASSGHYLADALRPTKDEESGKETLEWYTFDDASSAKTSIERVTRNDRKQTTAYMLLYGS